jgi:hypothetical protein
MNEVIRKNYPASKLPDDLRGQIDPRSHVTVVVTQDDMPSDRPLTLEEIFAQRRPPYRSKEEIDADLRRQRVEWDD